MADKFQNKYRTQSHRMPNWDYSWNGLYFITIVTQHRDCNLGQIINNKMVLSDFGTIVNDEWMKSFGLRNELHCDQYVIMPNHLHAIIVLDNTDDTCGIHVVETHGRVSLQRGSPPQPSPCMRMPKSISSFIAGFKSAVNSKIDDYIDDNHLDIPKYNRNNHFFQPNYYDHIIRNDDSYQRIANYIVNNPQKWGDDKFRR